MVGGSTISWIEVEIFASWGRWSMWKLAYGSKDGGRNDGEGATGT
jgi:hypothetical protein